MKIFGREISFSKAQNVDKTRPNGADVRRFIQKPQAQVFRIKTDQSRWKIAVTIAESVINPNRSQLYQVYQQVTVDAHLTAAIQQRKNLTLSKEFKVLNKIGGEENEQLTALIKRKWFRDFLDLSLDSIFYGYSLIQFGDLLKDEFETIELVPRIYVKPEFHIVVDSYAQIEGKDYLKSPYKDWCIGVGKSHDLGLLMKAAPLIIWKQNALGAWAEYQEIFGSPIRIGKTNVREEVTRANMEDMLKNMGNSAYGVFDTDDLIELVESGRQDAHNVFDMMIIRCNSEISKLMLGQTGTMDEKSFVGSAEVQERVLANYAELDEHFILGVINYQLIPMMERLGISFNGAVVQIEDDEDLPLIEAIKIDAELMKHFDIDENYILEKYGTPVKKREEPKDTSLPKMKNRLDEYYS